MPTTAPQLLHAALNNPPPGWPLEPHTGNCCTCGTPITHGVNFEKHIHTRIFSNHTTLTRWGSHACHACAWLYTNAKSKHRAFAVINNQAYWPVINVKSVTPERPHWLTVLEHLQAAPADTPVALLLTNDPKPRLWPDVIITTPHNPTLYHHNASLDLSENVRINTVEAIRVTRLVAHAQHLGFSKTTALHGLHRDHKRLLQHAPESLKLETALAAVRGTRELQVAVTIAQKEHHHAHP